MNLPKPIRNSLPIAILTILFALTKLTGFSQSRISIYDEEWKPTDSVKYAKYMTADSRSGDTVWTHEKYNYLGPLITVANYKDKAHIIAHGKFVYYNPGGRVDSIHHYFNGLPHGTWSYLKDTGRICIQKFFENGTLVKTIDYLLRDSLDKANGIIKSDSLLPGEKESEFKGGLSGWRRFLNKNFRFPSRALDNEIMGKVILLFVVDETGKIEDPVVLKSVEYSLDHETLRIMAVSPKWEPGVKDGKKVRTFKIQAITYRFE